MTEGVRLRISLYSLGELVHMGESGRFRLSTYSRPMVWGTHQIVEFFDSVYQGFPVGQLLFAEGPAPAEDFELGGITIHAPQDPSAWTVIDGLQRLSTIIGVWHADQTSRYALCYDLEERRFAPGAPEHLRMLPINVAVRPRELMAWIRERPFLSEDQQDVALSLRSRLTDYPLAVGVVPRDAMTVRNEMFTRLNRSGASLSQADVDRARQQPQEISSDLLSLGAQSRYLAFGEIPRQVAAQCYLAVLNPQSNVPLPGSQALADYNSAQTGRSEMKRVRSALGAAVRFLQEEARVPHFRLLPVPIALPLLVRFFSEFGSADTRAKELLRRWLWRSDGSERSQEKALEAIADSPVLESQRLIADSASERGRREVDLSATDIGTVAGRTNALAMLGAKPVLITATNSYGELPGAPLTDRRILTPWLDEAENIFCSLIPQEAVTTQTLACFVLHPPVPQPLLMRSVLEQPLDDTALDSHFIDSIGVDLLRHGRHAEFAAHRAAILGEAISRRVQSLARWGFRDFGSLPTLTDKTEDPHGHSHD